MKGLTFSMRFADMVFMKVIKEGKEFRNVSLRLSEDTMKKIDQVAEENDVSRQKLIEAILDQALNDKSFVVRLK